MFWKSWFVIAIEIPRSFCYYLVFHYFFFFLSIACKVFTTKRISLVFLTFETMFYNDGNTFLTTFFNAFVIIEWFVDLNELNSSSNSLFEILSIKGFLVDFLMCLYFIYGFKNVNIFFVRINSDKHSTKFFFYCFLLLSLYFIANISIIMT